MSTTRPPTARRTHKVVLLFAVSAVLLASCASVGSDEQPSLSQSPSPCPTESPSPVPTVSPSPVPTESPSPVPTVSPSPVPTESPSPCPTESPSPSPSPVPTESPSPTVSPSPSPSPTRPPSEGCSPGYWKQPHHVDSWVGFEPDQTLESVFDVPDAYGLDDVSLLDALSFRGGSSDAAAARILLRQAVAALLNASNPDVEFGLTTTQVVADVNAALASGERATILELAEELDRLNNLGCPLN
jgi:hypothetical protein